jgi:hypothetical protein
MEFAKSTQTDRFLIECPNKVFNDSNIAQSVIPAEAGIY